MRRLIVVGLGILVAAGCGDGSKQCGDGTSDENGVCVAPEDPPICGDGTSLDPVTGTCVIDPSVCGDGTVLIDGTCQDPSGDLELDLIEGPEPNGFEVGATPAGVIALPATGGPGFVIHGCIQPPDAATADLDVYELTVTGPTLIKVSADGVAGLAAGFLALGDPAVPQLASWFRLGINVATDTSKRELFLPAAGTYQLAIADTRTLLPITQNGEGFPAAGNLDGTSCYYVTVDHQAVPAPTPFDLGAGESGTIDEDLVFFTGPFPSGYTNLIAVIDPEDLDDDGVPDLDSHAAASLVLVQNGGLRQINDADATSPGTQAFFGGIAEDDETLLVLDYVWNYTLSPASYQVTVDAAVDSQPLSTAGGTVDATTQGQALFDDQGVSRFGNLNLFHFDVTEAGEVDGFDLASTIQLQGVIADADGAITSQLTTLQGNASFSTTFDAYRGLLRSPAPGRYYLVVFAPRDPVGTAFSVTSTIEPQVLAAITPGTPVTEPVNAFGSNAFTYDGGAEPWHRFGGSGTATGALAVQLLDPATAFGRLDAMTIRSGPGAGTASTLPSSCVGPCDLRGTAVQHDLTLAEDGSTDLGRILRNPSGLIPPAVTSFLVKVNPTAPTTGAALTLDFAARDYTDLGAIAGGQAQRVDDALAADTPARRYFVRAAPNDLVTITVTPTGAPATLNAAIARLDTRELDAQVIDQDPATGAETVRFQQPAGGFTAFTVRAASPGSIGGYTVDVAVEAAQYAVGDGTAAFADACAGGAAVTLADDGGGNGGGDEGLSDPIAPPAGFELFGQAVGSFRVVSNGFMTFDLAIPDAQFDNLPLVEGGSANIAPYWDDLGGVTVCTKTVGDKLVVQWTGFDFFSFSHVELQAILDPSDSSIELVWGPNHVPNGASATIGLAGDAGVFQLGFNQGIVVPGTSKKLTPQ